MEPTTPSTIFLLSPAHCGGRRAEVLTRPEADFDLAARLRSSTGAPLGEVFSFLSGLYFRGKLAYAERFKRPPTGQQGVLVISAGRGLLSPETRIDLSDIAAFAEVSIDPANPRYSEPLLTALESLRGAIPPTCKAVLLGSVATAKYVELLVSGLGDRLCFPESFIGIGDMSRGAILLRAARSGEELHYVDAVGATRSKAKSASTRTVA